MEKIKTFEEYTQSLSSTKNEEFEVDRGIELDKKSDIISDSLQKKMWAYAHESMESAVKYHNDGDEKHTIERYMAEAANVMAEKLVKALKENMSLATLAKEQIVKNEAKKQELMEEFSEEEAKNEIRKSVKEKLDRTCEMIKDSFTRKVDKAMNENAALAGMVASQMMKDKR
jgi:hypothetical protein